MPPCVSSRDGCQEKSATFALIQHPTEVGEGAHQFQGFRLLAIISFAEALWK
jgi:hypothetical protein